MRENHHVLLVSKTKKMKYTHAIENADILIKFDEFSARYITNIVFLTLARQSIIYHREINPADEFSHEE